MRTIKELRDTGKKIYFYLANEQIGNEFLKDAENEGYRFGDGEMPTARKPDDIMAITEKDELCYVGWAGRVCFHYQPENVIAVNYERYKQGAEDYLYHSCQPKPTLLN